jgi:BirA family biotin operon repressor/biotin-[acetyl-CoA-carboxylase] ligase
VISDEIASWPDRLEATCAGTRFDPELVRVVAQCDSTQDLARTLGRGAVVTTGRQVGGRGRLGRAWLDDEGAGIAISLVVDASDPAVLALAAGLAGHVALVGACPAAEARLGVKHPNDLVDRATTRKAGGVLVESDGKVAVVGIGLNVHPRAWPPAISAISISELSGDAGAGRMPTRLEILERLVPALDRLLTTSLDDLAASFAGLHAPTGRIVTLETPSGEAQGRLVTYDPRAVLEIEDAAGRRHRFPASSTRLLAWTPDDPLPA